MTVDESTSASMAALYNDTKQPPLGSWEGPKAGPTSYPSPSPGTWHRMHQLWNKGYGCCRESWLHTSLRHWSWQWSASGMTHLKDRLHKEEKCCPLVAVGSGVCEQVNKSQTAELQARLSRRAGSWSMLKASRCHFTICKEFICFFLNVIQQEGKKKQSLLAKKWFMKGGWKCHLNHFRKDSFNQWLLWTDSLFLLPIFIWQKKSM